MPKFTKGKWEYLHESGLIIVHAKKLEDDTQIAFVSGAGGFMPSQEGKANARLIAKAPEMYNMLHYMLGYVREWEKISSGRIYKAKVQKDIKEVEELLARIDGKENNNA